VKYYKIPQTKEFQISGERRIRETAEKAGFGRFRRAAQTPFNAIYEARL
jgi:hypothetical protein